MKHRVAIVGCILVIAVLMWTPSIPAQEVELNYNGRIKSGGMKSASGLAPGLCAITDLVAAPRDSQTSIGHPPPGGGHLGLDTVHDLADNHNPALRSLG